METEKKVAEHYGRGGLERAILDALAASGKDADRLSPPDLSGADEFHLGWRAATAELADELGLSPGMRVLDVGCGIGGPARHFAATYGCRVIGIDLTEDYVEVAAALTRRCGLQDAVSFQQANALSLPFADASFDAATLIHVGMNIRDKAALFAQIRRVLKPRGRFGVYDIMRTNDGDLAYPMPWAEIADTSFVETAETYRRLLAEAGFGIDSETDRSSLALTVWREMREKAAAQGAPPLGLHLLMGPTARQRIANVMGAVQQGVLAPISIVTTQRSC